MIQYDIHMCMYGFPGGSLTQVQLEIFFTSVHLKIAGADSEDLMCFPFGALGLPTLPTLKR